MGNKKKKLQQVNAAMQSEEARADAIRQRERAARVNKCLEEVRKLLDQYECELQVQGAYTQRLGGGPRNETVMVGVVPRDRGAAP
jgi:hypothetical protein